MSSDADEVIMDPSEWVPRIILYSIYLILTWIILKKEISNRRSAEKVQDVIFATKAFKSLSIICMISCFIFILSFVFCFIPGICLITHYLSPLANVSCLACMGYYQLYRLYYCFSKEKVYSDKGYPKWIFIIIAIFGSFQFIMIIIIWELYLPSTLSCGYRHDKNTIILFFTRGQSHFNKHFGSLQAEDIMSYFYVISIINYILWNLLILFLYIYKVLSLNYFRRKVSKQNYVIYKRIISILSKVVITSLMYQFTIILSLIAWSFDETGFFIEATQSFVIVTISFAMYLIMDHNKLIYFKLLNIIYKLKLYWICGCCCCKYVVIDSVNELQLELTKLEQQQQDQIGVNEHGQINENINNEMTGTNTVNQTVNVMRINSDEDISVGTEVLNY